MGRVVSLQARQLLAASLGLLAFLGFTGYALDRAFVDTADSNLRQRLQNYAWAYMQGTELLRNGDIIPPELPPDPGFSRVGSGIYATILADRFRWESESAIGRELPLGDALKPGEWRFEGPLHTSFGTLYRQSVSMVWEISEIREAHVTIHVAEDSSLSRDRQIAVFRRALWGYLGGLAVLLLGLQAVTLRWSLAPLRHVVANMEAITRGESERLSGEYPQELSLLTNSLNDLIDAGREQIERNRNILDNLAHSLKTPLAVMRSELEAEESLEAVRGSLSEQVTRMNDMVHYQLSRARAGSRTFSAPLPIEPCAAEIVESLEKVYAAKRVLCEFEIDPGSQFYGEKGDLMELMGNLLENAFKWAKSRVLLTVRVHTIAPNRRAGLLMMVEDDGPGIPEDQIERVLQRGVRGDERVQGHGIGLAIVLDLVKVYRGELQVERSEELGGARFVVRFAPTL